MLAEKIENLFFVRFNVIRGEVKIPRIFNRPLYVIRVDVVSPQVGRNKSIEGAFSDPVGPANIRILGVLKK